MCSAVLALFGAFWGLLKRKFDKVSARQSSAPNYCSLVAEKAIQPVVFRYRGAMSIFLGSKNVLKNPLPRHISIEVPPWGFVPGCPLEFLFPYSNEAGFFPPFTNIEAPPKDSHHSGHTAEHKTFV